MIVEKGVMLMWEQYLGSFDSVEQMYETGPRIITVVTAEQKFCKIINVLKKEKIPWRTKKEEPSPTECIASKIR